MPPPPSFRYIPNDFLHPTPFAEIFGNDHPVDVDLGAGKGRFLLARAARFPERNLLGIERKLDRVRRMDRKLAQAGHRHVRVLRLEAFYACRFLLPTASVENLFVFFPDPWPKKKHHAHRLFNADFCDAVLRVLAPNGVLHFATDHLPYFIETVEDMNEDARFSPAPPYLPTPEERSDFELLFLHEKPVGRFSWTASV